jgi:ribosomal protein L14E/L6E/L27E
MVKCKRCVVDFQHQAAFCLRRHYVEIGRVIYLRFGRYKDTLAVITDVIDQNWVLADGRAFPGGMMRAPVNLKDISLTHLKLKVVFFVFPLCS